ncbi:MAG: P-II family nitrogen regulator [Gemmatimonadota bacterium]
MKLLEGEKLITCILPHGRAMPVLEALKEELGLITATLHHARGTGRMTPLAWRGVGEAAEKDVISVVVPEARADEVFAFVFERAGVGRPHGGILYQQPLWKSTVYRLPDLPEEE